MKTLLYLIAIAVLLGGVALVVTDFPIEARFPAAGPAMIGFGLILNLTLFYLSHTKKL